MPNRKSSALRAVRPEVGGFHEAIRDDPDNDAPRLIFADWLDEFGDEADQAHAKYLRLSCELSAVSVYDSHWEARAKERQELFDASRVLWFDPLQSLNTRSLSIHTGFRGLFRLSVDARTILSKTARSVVESEIPLWFDDLQIQSAAVNFLQELKRTMMGSFHWFDHRD